jgi:hypothetical protein
VKRRFLAIAAALAVAALIVVGAYLVLAPAPATSNCSPHAPNGLSGDSRYVLAPCHTSFTLRPHSFESYTMVRLSDGQSVVGQYSSSGATSGSFALYVLNTTDFGWVLGHPNVTGAPIGWIWSNASIPDGSFSVAIPPSPVTYYLVLENTGNVSVAFEWTQTLTLFYTVGNQ